MSCESNDISRANFLKLDLNNSSVELFPDRYVLFMEINVLSFSFLSIRLLASACLVEQGTLHWNTIK